MFRTLRYLNEVYKEQSFSQAAKKLYLSQPSLSLTIKKFERELGIQIFDRSTTPIRLTEAGKVYMEGVQQILAIKNNLDTYLEDYKALKTGSLILGAPQVYASYVLPAFIARFLNKFPDVNVSLEEAGFLTLHEMMLSGEIDLLVAVGGPPLDDPLFKNHTLFEEHILLAVPLCDPINEQLKDYCLSKKNIRADLHIDSAWPPISLNLFQNHSFLMLKKGYEMHSRMMRMFRNSGFEPHVLMILNQLMTIHNMIDQQVGVSFVTDTIVKLSPAGNNVVYYKVEDSQSTRPINLIYKANRYISKPMREFIRMAGEVCDGDIISVIAQEQERQERL